MLKNHLRWSFVLCQRSYLVNFLLTHIAYILIGCRVWRLELPGRQVLEVARESKIFVSPHRSEDKNNLSFISFMFILSLLYGCDPEVYSKSCIRWFKTKSIGRLSFVFLKKYDFYCKTFKVSYIFIYITYAMMQGLVLYPSRSSMLCYFQKVTPGHDKLGIRVQGFEWLQDCPKPCLSRVLFMGMNRDEFMHMRLLDA